MNNFVFQERWSDGTSGYIKDLRILFYSLLWQVWNYLAKKTCKCLILCGAVLANRPDFTHSLLSFSHLLSIHWCQWKNNKVVKTIGTDAMKKVVFCKLIIRANNVIAVVLQLARFNGLHLIPKGAYMTSFIKVPWKKNDWLVKAFLFFSDLNTGLYAETLEISSLLSITTFVPSLGNHSMGLIGATSTRRCEDLSFSRDCYTKFGTFQEFKW